MADLHRATVGCVQRVLRINTKQLIDGGSQIGWRDRSFQRAFAHAVAGANDLPARNSTAGQHHTKHTRPVVTATLCV